MGAVATGGLYWWKYTSLGSLAHKLVSDDSLYGSYRQAIRTPCTDQSDGVLAPVVIMATLSAIEFPLLLFIL